ncbi:hypothetical protein [Micromonospora robiginosa]|uniref:Uncharacterized protein n=1 Tax=Micromonospora robiginosa TaxID=2749844 RepID=A0A7L6BDN6_9ACTN|nr:hypothetical protein [Micromonospora ferruginea]QLQ39998.1 hypothetical protein H1D33_14935 [Micromonospora ferruginea]
MSQPPTGAGDHQPPGGTVYGNPYGSRPTPPSYGPAQPDPTRPQPPVPGQYTPGAAPVPAPGAPMSAPPVSGAGYPPVSGGGYPPASVPPGSAPGYGGQPMSAPPAAGGGFGSQPMSGPPGPPYGPDGYGAPAPAPAGGGRGRTTLVLALVAGLLFVLGGVMTGLYVTTNGKLDKAERQVSQRDGTIAANQRELEKLRGEMKTIQDRLADTQQDLTGTKNDRDEQTRQKKVIASCLDKLTTAIAAASRGDRAAFEAANKGLDKICDEAENYV